VTRLAVSTDDVDRSGPLICPVVAEGAQAGAGRRRSVPKSPTKGDLREQALLDSAEKLLHERPLGELTMESVAAEAGLSRSAVYFYFASKTALVEALIERANDEVSAFFETPAADLGLNGYLVQTLAHVFRSWRLHGPVFQAAIEMSISDSAARARWRTSTLRNVDAIIALIERERRKGTEPGSPEVDEASRVAIESVCWMVERSCYALFTREHSEEDEQLLHNVLTGMVLGLASMSR
jgi:TetR/AcrR family transcriptional regulator, ethionamide resistance regulator